MKYTSRFKESLDTKVYILDKTLWFSWSMGSGRTVFPIYANRNTLKNFTNNPKGKNLGMITSESHIEDWMNWAYKTKPLKRIGDISLYVIPRYYNDFYMEDWTIYGGTKKPDELVYVVINTEESYVYISLFNNKKEAIYWMNN